MNILNFTYTKADGSVSEREFLPLITPNKMYEGYDLSELDHSDQVGFASYISDLYEMLKNQVAAKVEEFDLKQNYRRFDPTKMTNITKDEI